MSGARVTVTREAVEAAARSFPGYTPEDEADDLEREINEACRADATRILEVAAPHLIAFPMGMTQDEWEKHVRSYR